MLTGETAEHDELADDTSLVVLTYGTNIGTEVFASIDNSVPTKPDLGDFWNIESIGVTDHPNKNNDDIAMEQFKQTLVFENDRYVAMEN